jgi:hypothetical protein
VTTGFVKNIVAYLLKARTMMPEKQWLLANDSANNLAARKQILNKQQLNYNNKGTVGKGVFYAACAKGL